MQNIYLSFSSNKGQITLSVHPGLNLLYKQTGFLTASASGFSYLMLVIPSLDNMSVPLPALTLPAHIQESAFHLCIHNKYLLLVLKLCFPIALVPQFARSLALSCYLGLLLSLQLLLYFLAFPFAENKCLPQPQATPLLP